MSVENKTSFIARLTARLKSISARGIVQSIENSYIKLKKVIERSRHTFYRLVILNNDTFEEVGSYRLSLMNFYITVCSLFFGFALLVASIIVFTPLKRLIPGYGGYGTQRDVFELVNRVDSLERAVAAQQVYHKNFKKMLTADVEREGDIPKGSITAHPDSNINIEPSEAEMKIRAGGNSPFDGDETVSEGNKSMKIFARNDRLESMYLLAPISGQMNMGFSLDKKHYGVDLIAPKNTPVKATADGFVISSDWTLETGNTIAIQHSNNVVSFYKHNSSLLKKVGDKVKSGEAIAIIGNTGEQTNGPHLHFELWKDGKPVNPAEYMRF
jgi:hypothetical protein